MPRQRCLTPEELKAFSLGELAEPALEEIAENCS